MDLPVWGGGFSPTLLSQAHQPPPSPIARSQGSADVSHSIPWDTFTPKAEVLPQTRSQSAVESSGLPTHIKKTRVRCPRSDSMGT